MGASNTIYKIDTKTELDQKNLKLQNLIFVNESQTQNKKQVHHAQLKIKSKTNHPKVEMTSKVSSDQSEKNIDRDKSVISNFDKINIKNTQIQHLNQILGQQIKQYRQQKRKQHINHSEQSSKKPKKFTAQVQSIILGIWIGITASFVIALLVIIQVNNLSIANESQFSRDFPTWRGIAIWIFYVWMLGFDVWMFKKYKVRYREILKFAPDHYPEPITIYRIAGLHSSCFCIMFLLYVLEITSVYAIPGFAEEYFALVSWGLFVLFLCLPLPVLSNRGRYFVFNLIIDSILSPFRGVTFEVAWMTDQAVSMAVPLKDLQYTVCYYTQLDFNSPNNVCQDANRISAVLIVAVSICSIRIIQCIRQGYDKGEYFMTPFFFNTLKYVATLCTAVFAFQYKLGADQIQAAWLLFAIISSFYSFVWDVKMDWGLLQNNSKNPFLRQKLVFGSANLYYLIIGGNFLMRLAWIITISPKLAGFLGNNNLVFLVTGMIQIFRRGIWNLIRVENQHLNLSTRLPLKDQLLEEKAVELQNRLTIIENFLKLQIKILKFFKEIQHQQNRVVNELQKIHERKLDEEVFQAYYSKMEQTEIEQMSGLMSQMLRKNSFLLRKVNYDDAESVIKSQKIEYKQRVLK